MTATELFSWSPYLALVLGALTGLGALRSWRTAGFLAAVALLVQVASWTLLFVVAEVFEHGWGEGWQGALGIGFLWGLLVAFPYTAIGAVAAGALAGLVRSKRRRG